MAISGGDGSIILTTKVDEAGLKKGFASMRNFVGKVGKSFAVIGAAAATATVAITKMAVSDYADYEQLVGGVETLFKGSAQKVIDYANDAFYTAGVSANEYMQQVTSFSASLIRSTAGDTDKAADIANMALIDISDNVNKMGSSMESVQLAYQGFAKQQYMLLDNLKLGYGGTKTEMERLLKDAQALTGVKYDINNLADVYSAIHAIQEELGITGTTAKEAEKTITGSANMMKAAWQNVLSAIAGGGDLDRAINNLVYSISVYFSNIVPVVERSLVGIGKLIEQVGPLLVQNVASALIQSIPSLVNAVYQMIIGLAKGIWAGIKALFTGGKAQIKKQVSTIGGGGGFSSGGISSSGTQSGTGGGGSGSSGAKGKSAEEEQIDAEGKAIQDKIKALQKENKQIAKNDKANRKANERQLASFDDITTLGSNQMSEADAMIDKNNEEIDQLQEQLDLLREKKQAIQDVASASGGAGGIGSIGGIGGGGFGVDTSALTETGNEVGGFTTVIQEQFAKIAEIAKTLWDSTPVRTFVEAAKTTLGTLWSFATTMWGDIKNNSLMTWHNIQGDLQTIGGNLVALWTSFWSDFNNAVKTWGQPIINSISNLFNSIWKTAIDPFIQLVTGVWADFTQILLDLWNEHGKSLLNNIGEFVNTTIGLFQSIYDNVLEPIITPFLETLSWLWEEHLSKMVYALGDFIMTLVNGALEIYNKFIEPLVEWLLEKLAPAWSFLSELVIGVAGTIIGTISDLVTGLLEVLTGLIDFIVGVFTDDWEKAWEGVASVFKGIWDGIWGVAKGIINLIINALNSFIAGINKIKFDVPEWVPGLGGKTWGFDIPKIHPLAQGTVVPPNRKFLAMLGDNTKEHEIVSPLSTMKQAFTEAMIEMGGNFGGGNTEVVLEIDGREFGRAVVEQGNRENRRIGTRLVIV